MSPFVVIMILILFAAALLAVSIYSTRVGSKTIADYLVAGRSIGKIAFVFYSAFGIISAWTIYGYPGFMSYAGIAFNTYHLSAGFGIGVVTFWFLGYRLYAVGRLYSFNSPLEAIGDRYSSQTLKVIVALILIIFMIPYIGLQFVALGAGIKAACPTVPYTSGAAFMLIVTVSYV